MVPAKTLRTRFPACEPVGRARAARGPGAVVRWRVWWCGWWLLASLTASLAEDPVPKEYQIKAAYLYNFAKFVTWPEHSFTNDQAPLVIGVLGQNPFGQELQNIARDHQINGRPILIRPVATVGAAAGVHMLFFSSQEDARVAGELAGLKDAGVLTVGESEAFATAGGVIYFVREDDKVRFEINPMAAAAQRLKISAQLLKLARPVHRQP